MLDAYFRAVTLSELESRIPTDAAEVKNELISLLESAPGDLRAKFLLARCRLACNEEAEAELLFEDVLRNDPDNIPARIELAKSWFRNKRLAEAIKLLKEVLAFQPELDEVWRVLAGWLASDGQPEASKNAAKQYAMVRAFNTKLFAAEKLLADGNARSADQMCRELLQLLPKELRTLRLLARIALGQQHYEYATETLASCIEVRPNDQALRLEYARALQSARRYAESLQQCEAVLQAAPELLEAYEIKAENLYNLGLYGEAIEIYRALSSVPAIRPTMLLHLGKVLKTVGETSEATTCYERALDLEPSRGQAYWELANLRTYRFSEQQQGTMRTALDAGELPVLDRILMQFSLGKALEDEGCFDESFGYYDEANKAYGALRPYRPANRNEQLQDVFTADYFAALQDPLPDENAPIFIVGLPRSGSTLLEQILSSHSQVDATRELDEIVSIARTLRYRGQATQQHYAQVLASSSSQEVRELATKYLESVKPHRKGAPYFLDKAPQNFVHIGLIKTLFPRARVIDVRRNPMAAGWSLYRHFFGDSFLFSYDLAAIGAYYSDYVALMDHWHEVLPGQVLTVRYEDLVSDLPRLTAEVLDYCGLDFEDGCLDFHENRRAVATPSSEQVRQPLYRQAVDHWKHYEAHLGELKRAIDLPGPGRETEK